MRFPAFSKILCVFRESLLIFFLRYPDQLLTKCRVIHSKNSRFLRDQACRRHSRKSICFQTVDLFIFRYNKIKSCIAFQPKSTISFDCILLQTSGQLFRNRSRTGFLYRTWFIFVFIIIKSFTGNNLDYRICFAVYNCNCVFRALDIFLNDHFLFIRKGRIKSSGIFFLVMHNINTDAGTSAAGFYHYRK